MALFPEDILKLLLAMALGGAIGMEREYRDKDAGFRTLMFICAGSAMFTIFSVRISSASGGDPARIAAQIVSGIGFLGAGVILREHGEVRGLTTAATIWLTAAIGVGVGSGQYLFSALSTATFLLALFAFPYIERKMSQARQVNAYRVTIVADREVYYVLEAAFRENKLKILTRKRTRSGDEMICTWVASGPAKGHEAMAGLLFEEPRVKGFDL